MPGHASWEPKSRLPNCTKYEVIKDCFRWTSQHQDSKAIQAMMTQVSLMLSEAIMASKALHRFFVFFFSSTLPFPTCFQDIGGSELCNTSIPKPSWRLVFFDSELFFSMKKKAFFLDLELCACWFFLWSGRGRKWIDSTTKRWHPDRRHPRGWLPCPVVAPFGTWNQ